jgi:hypothetical protein
MKTAQQPNPATLPSQERRYKMAVYYVVHKLPKAHYMRCNKGEEMATFLARMKRYVKKNEASVNWARIYDNGQPFLEWTNWTNDWNAPGSTRNTQ